MAVTTHGTSLTGRHFSGALIFAQPGPGRCDRFEVCVTDLADDDIAYLEAVYRGRGRAELSIADHKDSGLAHLPSWSFAVNSAWLQVTLMAMDLLAWSRRLLLDEPLATAAPKRLRYTLLYAAGQIVRTARRRWLRLPRTWPWTDRLVAAFDRLGLLQLGT